MHQSSYNFGGFFFRSCFAFILAILAVSQGQTNQLSTIKGDINGNGVITPRDAQIAFEIWTDIYLPTELEFSAADYDQDGIITENDIVEIINAYHNSILVQSPPQEITIDLPGLPEGSVPLQLVWIPPGKFMMGSTDDDFYSRINEKPQHEVKISNGFYLGKYEITNAQYRTFRSSHDSTRDYIISLNRNDQPAVHISWNDALDYCSWLNQQNSDYFFRLPTEAEWEYSCRAGTTTPCYWGEPWHNYFNYAVIHRKYYGYPTSEVGSKQPNKFNLYDMGGNVYEWCSDWFGLYSNESLINPVGPQTGTVKIRRGGSFVTESARNFRSAYRFYASVEKKSYTTGFRISASIIDSDLLPTITPTSIAPTESPTATPTLPPTFTLTPTVTPTATHTSSPTLTPTPQPTFDSNQPPQEITIDLPGLPEGAVPLQLVWIPAGKFMMGSPEDEVNRSVSESPQHEVIIPKGYYLGKYEITESHYFQYLISKTYSQSIHIPKDRLNKPQNKIRWSDASQYCEWLTANTPGWVFRLPSEAEWEYACRANTTTRFSHGDANECDDPFAECSIHNEYFWWKTNSNIELKDVGLKKSNPWGLHDMHGSLGEWCLDNYHINYAGAPTDGSAWIDDTINSKVIRGGSWLEGSTNCRSASRVGSQSSSVRYLSTRYGFRIVAEFIGESFTNRPSVEIIPIQPKNIFTDELFPDPNFRKMIQYYVLRDYADNVISVEPLHFTALLASQVEGPWDYAEIPGVEDGDIRNLTGMEFFTGICSLRTNSYFSISLGRCP